MFIIGCAVEQTALLGSLQRLSLPQRFNFIPQLIVLLVQRQYQLLLGRYQLFGLLEQILHLIRFLLKLVRETQLALPHLLLQRLSVIPLSLFQPILIERHQPLNLLLVSVLNSFDIHHHRKLVVSPLNALLPSHPCDLLIFLHNRLETVQLPREVTHALDYAR
jgi:hypothetical protein